MLFSKSQRKIMLSLSVLQIFLCSVVLADNLNDAQKALKNEQYKEAIIHLKNELKQNPDNAEARHTLAVVYSKTGNQEAAEDYYKKALLLTPDDSEYLLGYAEFLLEKNDYRTVLKALKEPIKDADGNSRRLVFLGYAYLGLKQLAEAEKVFNEANQLKESVITYNGLVSLALFEQDLERANTLLSKSLSLEPADQDTLQLKAVLANQNKQYKEAIEIYNNLVKANPDNYIVLLERAATFITLGDADAAYADINHIFERYSNHPKAMLLHAQLKLEEGDFQTAMVSANKILKNNPKQYQAMFILGTANAGLKNYNQAYKYLENYLVENPSDMDAQNMIASVLIAQGKASDAIKLLEGIAPETLNKNAESLFTLGKAYYELEDFLKASTLLNKARLLDPDNVNVQKVLVSSQIKSGILDDAIPELENLTKLEQTDQSNTYLLVISYFQQNEFIKAEEKINQLLIYSPDDTSFLNLNAMLKFFQKDYQAAEGEYNKIIQLNDDNLPARMGLAQIAITQKKWSDAQGYYLDILGRDSRNIKAYISLALISDELNQPEQAEEYLLQAMTASGDDFNNQYSVVVLLGKRYLQQHDYAKLESFAGKWVKNHPSNIKALSFFASAQTLNNNIVQAEKTLSKIILNDKKDVKHRLLLAQLLNKQGRADEALILIKQAEPLNPDNFKLLETKINTLIKIKDYEQALSSADELNKKFPYQSQAKIQKADIYRAQGNNEKAFTLYEEIYKETMDDQSLIAIVQMMQSSGKSDDALSFLKAEIDKNNKNSEAILQLARLYHSKGQLNSAVQYYERMLLEKPDNITALNNLAMIYSEKKNPDALGYARKAYELSVNSAAVTDTYGYVLLRNNKYQEAITILKQAVQMAPLNKEIKYHLAQAYGQNKENQQAVRLLEEILASGKFVRANEARTLLEQLK